MIADLLEGLAGVGIEELRPLGRLLHRGGQGRIAGQGRQEELLKQCPLYAQMWNTYLGTRDGKEE